MTDDKEKNLRCGENALLGRHSYPYTRILSGESLLRWLERIYGVGVYGLETVRAANDLYNIYGRNAENQSLDLQGQNVNASSTFVHRVDSTFVYWLRVTMVLLCVFGVVGGPVESHVACAASCQGYLL